MRRIASPLTPVTDLKWRAELMTAVTQHYALILVDSYDDITGEPIPRFCFYLAREDDMRTFLCKTIPPLCDLVEKGCFSMYVDEFDATAPLEIDDFFEDDMEMEYERSELFCDWIAETTR